MHDVNDITVGELIKFLGSSAIQAGKEQAEARLLAEKTEAKKVNGESSLTVIDDEMLPRINMMLQNQQTIIEQNLEIIKKLDSVAGQSAKATISLIAQGEAMDKGANGIVGPLEDPPKPEKKKRSPRTRGKMSLGDARRFCKHHNWSKDLSSVMTKKVMIIDIADRHGISKSCARDWLRKQALKEGCKRKFEAVVKLQNALGKARKKARNNK